MTAFYPRVAARRNTGMWKRTAQPRRAAAVLALLPLNRRRRLVREIQENGIDRAELQDAPGHAESRTFKLPGTRLPFN